MGQVFNRERLTEDAQSDGPNNPEVAWWCKLLSRVVACVGAGIAFILSILCLVNLLHPSCIGAGIIQMLAAFIVLIFEAPICCQFLEFTKPVANFAEKRTYFQKAIIYCILAIPPIAICFGLTTIFGSGLIFAAGVVYGLMALGRKADREQMRDNASYDSSAKRDDQRSNLIESGGGGQQETSNADPGNPFSPGSSVSQAACQNAGQYASQYATQQAGPQAGQFAGQYVQSQFSK